MKARRFDEAVDAYRQSLRIARIMRPPTSISATPFATAAGARSRGSVGAGRPFSTDRTAQRSCTATQAGRDLNGRYKALER